ncbi:hypothetical protein DMUE_4799 [Dictyocoela muelleri]|nr:hypothetical protein DMUE_4799 [Dictyocoela muelleri]
MDEILEKLRGNSSKRKKLITDDELNINGTKSNNKSLHPRNSIINNTATNNEISNKTFTNTDKLENHGNSNDKNSKIMMTQDTIIGFNFDISVIQEKRKSFENTITIKFIYNTKDLKINNLCICFVLSIDLQNDIGIMRLVDESGEVMGCINKRDIELFDINTNSIIVLKDFSVWREYNVVVNIVGRNIVEVF